MHVRANGVPPILVSLALVLIWTVLAWFGVLDEAVIAETFVGYCLLLSPYLCFISFLYRDLYVLGDDALIS